MGPPGPKAPGGEGACGGAPGLPTSPPCSELGYDSASQDTSLQSACEGGPCTWALCTLSLWPCRVHLSPTPGPLGASRGHLTIHLARQPGGCPGCSWKQPIQTHCPRPRAAGRLESGCHRAQPASPVSVTLADGASYVDTLNVGSQISYGGCARWGLLEPRDVV